MKTLANTLAVNPGALLAAVKIASFFYEAASSLPLFQMGVIIAPIGDTPTLMYHSGQYGVSVNILGAEGTLTTPLTAPLRKLGMTLATLQPGADTYLSPREEDKPGIKLRQEEDGEAFFKATMFGVPAEETDAARPQPFDVLGTITFTGAELIGALRTVVQAVSTDETRVILTGVLMEVPQERGKVKLIATDTHRLHITSLGYEDKGGEMPPRTLLPTKVVRFLLSQMKSQDTVVIEVGKRCDLLRGRATITKEATTEGTRSIVVDFAPIDGQYPDYQRVIGLSASCAMTVSRTNLLAGLRRLRLAASENANRVVIGCYSSESGQFITLESEANETRASETIRRAEVPASRDGHQAAVAVGYLISILEVIADDMVTLYQDDPLRPFLIHGGKFRPVASDRGTGAHFILMPMQII